MPDELNSDKPISREEDDLLGRHPLAYRIADMINNLGDDYKDSVVIGIEGEWGAGKSSFINLILSRARPNKKNLVIEFNPWNFSDQNELIKDFFNSITNALDKIYGRKSLMRWIYKKLSRTLKFYRLYHIPRRVCKLIFRMLLYPFRLLGIDIFIKGIREIFRLFGVLILELLFVRRPPKNPSKRIKNYSSKLLKPRKISVAPSISILGIVNIRLSALWKFRYSDNDSLEDQRKEIDKFLRKFPRRLVIVIDDIDRLDSEETKLIFKLVKLTSNFPNTVFLLAYDRDKVGKRMDEKVTKNSDTGIKGEEYLSKIVQLAFLMPKPDSEDITDVLRSAISDELGLESCDEGSWDESRLDQFLDRRELRKLFSTIRDIRRYTNSLHLDLKIIDKNEINLVDFVGIEALRVFAPEVYLAMSNERNIFTRTFGMNTADDVRKKYIGEIIDKAPKGLTDSVTEIIRQLFPQVKAMETEEQTRKNVTDVYISSLQSQEIWVNEKRVCSEEMYDKYFRLSVPKSRLSVGEMEDFIPLIVSMEMEGIEETRRTWKKFEDQGKIRSISKRLRGYLDDLSDLEKKALLVNIFDFAEKTKDRKQGQSDVEDFATQAERTGYRILEEIQVGRAQFLEDVINWTMGFFVMTELIKTLMNRQLENTRIRNGKEPLLTETEKDKVQKAYIAKIKSSSQEVPLESGREWWETLKLWKVWGEERDVKIYIENMIRTNKGVLSLLREFDRMSRAPLAMTARKMLEEFIDLSKLDQRVDTIDRNGLSEDDDRIIELYKNPPKDPWDSS